MNVFSILIPASILRVPSYRERPRFHRGNPLAAAEQKRRRATNLSMGSNVVGTHPA